MNFLAHFQLAAPCAWQLATSTASVREGWGSEHDLDDARLSDDWQREGLLHEGLLHEGLLIGALLGDFVKGPLRGEWPPAWEQGIRLHRRLDARSDTLPQRALLAQALPLEWRRYAGILFDLYFDFWLSNHWSECANQPLAAFSQHVYQLLARYHTQLPDAAQRFSARLRDHDLLNRYHDWAVVTGALARIGGRLRRPVPLAEAGALLLANQPLLDAGCAIAWRDLRRVAEEFARELSPRNAG